MVKKVVFGLLQGVLLGGVVSFALSRLHAGWSAAVAYAAAALVGVLVGAVAGKPIWAQEAKLEGLLKPLGALAPSSLPATLLDGRAVLFTVVAEDDRLVASLESPGGLGSDLGSLLSALATRGPEGWIDAKGGPSAP